MISIFGQWSGNGLGYFNATIYKVIGYESSSTQLLLNLVNSIVSAIGALSAVYLTDRMRRRPVLIFGTMGTLDLVLFSLYMSHHTNEAYSLCCHPGNQCRYSPRGCQYRTN